jgi:hypothetical protein
MRPENVVFDVIPGKKTMTPTLADPAPPGAWMLYLEHDLLGYARAEPGTEKCDRWRSGEVRTLRPV